MLRATIVQSALFRTRGLTRHRPFPTKMVYPGLSGQHPLWTDNIEQCHSDICEALRANYSAIREDYENLMAAASERSDYVDEEHRLHSGDWDWQSYMKKGEVSGAFAAQCPNTVNVLETLSHRPVLNSLSTSTHHDRGEQCQSLFKGVPFGYAFFSTMGPHSKIEPHYGPCNVRLRCHLPLIVPPGDSCGMEIGGHQVSWKENSPIFFDDSYSHHVWNNSDSKRVILLFDLWHPELERDEIEAIKDMFDYLKNPPAADTQQD